jgi:antitoxin HicB
METSREYDVVLALQPDGGYTVSVPALPDVVSEGDTASEALEHVKEALEVYLESLASDGRLPPAPSATWWP